MVRFSDFINVDSELNPDVQSHEISFIKPSSPDTEDDRISADLLSNYTGNENIMAYYRLLFERVTNIQKQGKENQESYAYLTVPIFRHILEHNLLDEFQKYAASVPGTFAPVSRIISVALDRIKSGMDLGCDTNRLLKIGFDALIQDVDLGRGMGDHIQEAAPKSPEEIDLIEMYEDTGSGTLAQLLTEWTEELLSVSEKRGDEEFVHDNITGFADGGGNEMEELDHEDGGLIEIARKRKSSPAKSWVGIIILLLIVTAALWFTGTFPFSKSHVKPPVTLEEEKTAAVNKTIESLTGGGETETGTAVEGGSQPGTETAPPETSPLLSDEKTSEVPMESIETPKTPSPQDTAKEVVSPRVKKYPYSLQVGSFQNIDRARDAVQELTKKGLSPYWVQVDLGEKGKWFRIFVGYFSTVEAANQSLKSNELKVARVLKTAYAIRVGTSRSIDEPDPRVETLKKAGYCPYYVEQAGNRYELLVGAYQDKKDAEKTVNDLESAGVSGEVILR